MEQLLQNVVDSTAESLIALVETDGELQDSCLENFCLAQLYDITYLRVEYIAEGNWR